MGYDGNTSGATEILSSRHDRIFQSEKHMKKLSLNVDTLKVESFDTRKVDQSEGTVVAHARTFPAGGETCAYHCTWYPAVCG